MNRTVLAIALMATPALGQSFNEPPLAVDIDPSPTAVEINLTAAPTTWEYIDGVQTNVWAYNGTVPGPTLFRVVVLIGPPRGIIRLSG